MIRLANLFDVDKINELGVLVDNNFNNVNDIKNDLENKRKIILVYEVDNLVVALAIFNIILDELELIDICVQEDYRNQGIGFNLIKEAFEMHNKTCFLEVNTKNKNAIKLYNKLGFNVINTRKNYYKNKEDAYVMERKKI